MKSASTGEATTCFPCVASGVKRSNLPATEKGESSLVGGDGCECGQLMDDGKQVEGALFVQEP